MPAMTSTNLFEIDPDKLFEQSSIEEIQSTQVKLHHEIERKREELRTMVGERYRDLIEAADTIAEMKEVSQNVIGDIENVSAATEEMYQKHPRSDGRKRKDSVIRHVQLNKMEGIAIQMKVLIDLPEEIWVSIDGEDYAKAARLFLLARHVKTSLEIHNIRCPMLEHQWSMLVQFKETILKAAERMLKEQTLIPDSACNCFMTIALLENQSSKGLVSRFLELRSAALRHLLTPGDSFEDANKVKTRFLSSYTLITSTSLILYSCFIESPSDDGDGMLWKKLKDILGREAKPTIDLLSDIDCNLLPMVITTYRPSPDCSLDPVPPGEMATAVTDWLAWVRSFVGQSGKALLEILNSLRSLQGLRHASQELPPDWGVVLQRLMQPPTLDLWGGLYRPLVVQRAKQLVSSHWQSGLDHVRSEIARVASSVLDDGKSSEVDLRWYVWKEGPDDLTSPPQEERDRGLWLKSKGISKRVAEMCRVLETRLSLLMSDLATLCPEREVASDVLADNRTLLAHQQAACLELVAGLNRFIGTEIENSKCEAVPALYARYLQTIPKLCPSLQKCLSGADLKMNAWQTACALLSKGTESGWSVWRTRVMAVLSERIVTILAPLNQLSDLLHTIPQWEVVSIQEVGEAEQTVSSELRVPSAPSIQLLRLLAIVNTALGRAFAPLCATELVAGDVVLEILKVYEGREILCHAHAWQHLFDLRYLTVLLVSPENKALQATCHEAISKVEKSVDPFDLDVFTPYIQENIRKALKETQLMLGVLAKLRMIPSGAQPGAASTQPNEDPSVLALSASGPSVWFPLLPVTAPPGTRAINPPKAKAVKGGSPASSGDAPAKMAVASAATSFFGSMTADWFG